MTASTFADRLVWSRQSYEVGCAGVPLGDDAPADARASHALGLRDRYRASTHGLATPTPAALRAVAIEEGRHEPLGYVPSREGAS